MEIINFSYPAAATAHGQILVGVVGSGDLEVLLEAGQTGATTVCVTTSVDGCQPVWHALLERFFGSGEGPALRVEINDFGATPGVVSMRIAQALEEMNAAQGK
ncbi:malonate decarboxylase subunit delta [Paludibacterium yongneupense]|uniref:malonate decarboxylase subunit delta n=1 Tax=Paludibacterium yongneupense TaxID=400061 RepID=UPI000407CEC3|nr:malonate decarboxylase subunit delta [Paludibacterium yongneupense]